MRSHAPILVVAVLLLTLAGVTLELRPGWTLREEVELRLAARRAFAGARMKVETNAERVTLTGNVREERQRERAVAARGAPGVQNVRADVTLRRNPSLEDLHP